MDADRAAALWEANAEIWTKHARAGYDVYRDAVNTPQFLAMLPAVEGLRGLDIGCGEGGNTRAVAQRGAKMSGIDVAPTFIAYAEETERADPLDIFYQVGNALVLPFGDGTFDFVTAFMSFMDVPDYQTALAEVRRVLRPGGFFQFSILHPCFVPPHRRTLRDARGVAYAIEVARYFDNVDGQIERWKFSAAPDAEKAEVGPFEIMRFHLTLSAWFNTLVGSGFAIEAVGEPVADDVTALAEPIVADTQIAPIFLHIRVRRSQAT
jgi:ubiquinone/menaquinone biosynthesis C-methylase UbiE